VRTTLAKGQAIESTKVAPIGRNHAAIRAKSRMPGHRCVGYDQQRSFNQHSFPCGGENADGIVGRETGKQRRETRSILARQLAAARTERQGHQTEVHAGLGAQVRSRSLLLAARLAMGSEGGSWELWQAARRRPTSGTLSDTSFIRWPRA